MGAAWGDPQVIVRDANVFRWSPAGDRLTVEPSGPAEIAVAALDGTIQVLVDPALGYSGNRPWSEWSADGRLVYFQAGDPSSGAQPLYAVPVTGGRPRPVVLFDDPAKQVRYGMSLHGDRAYFSVTEYESDIWVMEVEVGR